VTTGQIQSFTRQDAEDGTLVEGKRQKQKSRRKYKWKAVWYLGECLNKVIASDR